MSDTNTPEPLLGAFHNSLTGETITRELTQEEINALPKADSASPDA